jgi:formylglycine-generating enzyme required for sulfatase activity
VIENIGEASGRGEEVTALLEKPRNLNRQFDSHIDIKKLDKKLTALTSKLYASETEVTNEFYEQFLLDLLKEKEFDLLAKCKSDKVDWMSFMPESLKHLTKNQVYSVGDPDNPIAPVTNISYEAALAYCDWLTIVYNNYGKKKKFQEVKFRLPTEEEWEYAAHGGTNAEYPWGGNYHRNLKGCYLSNFYSHDLGPCTDCKATSPDNDGGYFLVHAYAYFPNNYGIYGTSGNAAEMIEGGKIAKGGSWEDVPEECKIKSRKTVTGPSPAIGFRIFMEVIR